MDFTSAKDATKAGLAPVGPHYGREVLIRLVGVGDFAISWTSPGGATGPAVVERSEHVDGPWVEVARTDQTQIMDTPMIVTSHFQRWYYRVVYGTTILGPEVLADEVDPTDPLDRTAVYAAWMARRYMARIGEKAYLFSVPTEGERCPECWDATRGVQLRSRCRTCDGTTYLRGAPNPVPLHVSFSKEQPATQRTQSSKILAGQIQAWTCNYPLLRIGDVIVRDYDRYVFEVSEWQPTRSRSFIMRQNIIARLVERGSAYYDYADLV